MLTAAIIERVLARLPKLHIGVVGDLFLDRYLDLDARLTEPSVETGLDAYQVVRVRAYPGAAGTVLNNLAALGVGRVSILSVIGTDGEGYELRRELDRRRVEQNLLFSAPDRFTPTYTKPMLEQPGEPARELSRLDLKNRTSLAKAIELRVLDNLPRLLAEADALVVLDQVRDAECGVVTTAVRERLATLATARPAKFILADSRERIGLFRNVSLKPNRSECLAATPGVAAVSEAALALAEKSGRAVFCTRGEQGILLAHEAKLAEAPAFAVKGPIDPVGAGDSVSAGIACAVAAGCSFVEAAVFGNLVASITIQQLGATGTATPEQVRVRWEEVNSPQRRRERGEAGD
jgi:rfaE bifunctional protein kinase chain/domain